MSVVTSCLRYDLLPMSPVWTRAGHAQDGGDGGLLHLSGQVRHCPQTPINSGISLSLCLDTSDTVLLNPASECT
jgi:hypothetical protein